MTVTQIGPYPVEREVGRGGMGVVYRARDPRLDRTVAIKVLPEHFARDPDRLARFEREARLLASITHPNIAGIYGIEEAQGQRFLALEFVEGETLAERLARGPMPLDETLDVCRQIASALEAAHEAGIVHRDLKPGNVKLTPSGDVKVLDFGLAKSAAVSAEPISDLTQSPTVAVAATTVGMILGTAAYMSPEQARGKAVDRRTDIWSFGCLLYQCLTGQQAFEGETVSDLIALILQGDPDWFKLPPNTPDKLRLLLTRCLERDARRRLRDIGDARIEIEELQGLHKPGEGRRSSATLAPKPNGPITAAAPATSSSRLRTVGLGAALLAGGAIVGALSWNAARPARDLEPMRFTVQAPPALTLLQDPNESAISPDGRLLVYGAADSVGRTALWLRPLDSFESRELPGTSEATLPFWSPDSRQIAFFAGSKLKRLRIAGGNPEVICDAATGRGGTWNKRNVIVFSPSPSGPLYRVNAGGGKPEAVTVVDTSAGHNAHRWPCFLPDGEHFTFAALPTEKGGFQSYVGSLGSKTVKPLLHANSAPVYAPPGHLIFTRSEALLAQRFDTRRLQLVGDPFTIGDPPGASFYSASPGVSVSTGGVLAWQAVRNPALKLAWLDRTGREVGRVGVPNERWQLSVLSPDGRRAMVEQRIATGQIDLWIVDLERDLASRLTYQSGQNTIGAWSPDGREILYSSTRNGPRDIFRRAADGSGQDQLFHASDVPFKDATDWSPDGRLVVITQIGDENGWDILVMPAEGGAPRPLIATPFNEQFGFLSPDGRWILYVSDETGTLQAYVQAFPGLGAKQQVSRAGAGVALWGAKGREILIVRPDQWVVSVPVTTVGNELRVGASTEMFMFPQGGISLTPAPDGQRFLASLPAVPSQPGISVAVNWRAGHNE